MELPFSMMTASLLSGHASFAYLEACMPSFVQVMLKIEYTRIFSQLLVTVYEGFNYVFSKKATHNVISNDIVPKRKLIAIEFTLNAFIMLKQLRSDCSTEFISFSITGLIHYSYISVKYFLKT